MSEIRIWNRQAHREEGEQVYGAELVNWLYGTRAGQLVSRMGLTSVWPSRAYGWLQSSSISKSKVGPFIRKFGIKMEEFEEGPFGSFNEFFVRRFRPGARKFVAEPGRMAAFAEARYLAFENVKASETFPVKGEHLSAEALLGPDTPPILQEARC